MNPDQARQARGVAQRAASRRAILSAMPGTYKDVMADTGLCWGTVRQHLAALRAEQEIHIDHWQAAPLQGKPCPVFVRGAGEDARPVVPATPHAVQLAQRREVRNSKAAKVRATLAASPVDGIVPAALMAQGQAFALSGVWA